MAPSVCIYPLLPSSIGSRAAGAGCACCFFSAGRRRCHRRHETLARNAQTAASSKSATMFRAPCSRLPEIAMVRASRGPSLTEWENTICLAAMVGESSVEVIAGSRHVDYLEV